MNNLKEKFESNEWSMVQALLKYPQISKDMSWYDIAVLFCIKPDGDYNQRRKASNDIWRKYNRLVESFQCKGKDLENLYIPDDGKKVTPKRLFFDIETSYNIVKSWRIGYNLNVNHDDIIQERAIITVAYKWEGDDNVYVITWNKGDDKELVKEFVKILDEADEIIGHNCLEISTPILTKDLEWIPAGELKKGDILYGFEEETESYCRDMKESKVTANKIVETDCFEVTLSNGDKIITTPEHKWLMQSENYNGYKWIETKDLKIGDRATKYFNTWGKPSKYEEGWLSGFLEGEGTLNNSIKNFQMSFCQRPTTTLEKALKMCDNLNIELSDLQSKKGGLGKQDTLYIQILGGKFKTLEIIGKLNIQRFKDKININNLGKLKSKNLKIVSVVDIQPVGKKQVAVLSTSTKTYFGAGYAMHNCDKYDMKFVASRALKHSIPMLAKYKTTDTLKLARKHFGLNSNKLDYIAQFLGIGAKLKHRGMEMWDDIILRNDENALDEMLEYNVQDVRLTEDVFNKLKNYTEPSIHHGVIAGEERHSCPECGEVDGIVLKKTYVSKTGVKTRLMECACGTQFKLSDTNYRAYYEK